MTIAFTYKPYAVIIFCAFLFLGCERKVSITNPVDSACGISANECDLCAKNDKDKLKFTIAVVGDGVEDTYDAADIQSSTNRAQGSAMWRGIRLAYDTDDSVELVKDLIQLKGFDDGGSKRCSNSIANCVYRNSCVLAVIGHVNSGTTKEAAPIYRKANIPLVMPIATSPNVFYEGDDSEGIKDFSNRLNNLFRLPPNDLSVQSYAMGYYAKELLAQKEKEITERALRENSSRQKSNNSLSIQYKNKVFLLRDGSETAVTYTRPIFEELDQSILARSKFKTSIVGNGNASGIADEIYDSNVSVVVFVGYWPNVKPLLSRLAEKYSSSAKIKPAILLSDGCMDSSIDNLGFDVSISFPLPDINSSEYSNTPAVTHLRQLGKQQSYEIYGYDSLRIISQAIQRIRDQSDGNVTRAKLINTLNSGDKFSGAISTYSFSSGEGVNQDYFIHRVGQQKVFRISGKTIREFRDIIKPDK